MQLIELKNQLIITITITTTITITSRFVARKVATNGNEINYDSTVNLFEPRKVVTFVFLGCFVCEVQF